MSKRSILCLGGGQGWHADQLIAAAGRADCRLEFARYESLAASAGTTGGEVTCEAGGVDRFDAILTRTMPAGNLEQVNFRLAILHQLQAAARHHIVNPPRSLEIAIDKYATLAVVSQLGYPVPETRVVQSRAAAMDGYHELGRDCIVKPLFGGEGRGVMRIQDRELAWYTFTTLEQLGAVLYLQQFVPPGGRDTRLLVIGDRVFGIRRENATDFRTNSQRGTAMRACDPSTQQTELALHICRSIGLTLAAVDLIDTADGGAKVLEVNAIPGWKGAQRVLEVNIADEILRCLQQPAGWSPHSTPLPADVRAQT